MMTPLLLSRSKATAGESIQTTLNCPLKHNTKFGANVLLPTLLSYIIYRRRLQRK